MDQSQVSDIKEYVNLVTAPELCHPTFEQQKDCMPIERAFWGEHTHDRGRG